MQIYKPGSAPEKIFPLQKIVGQGFTRAAGKTVPNGAPGYATGCVFQDLDGESGEQFLINESTNATAGWAALGFGSGALLATVAEINRTADVSARVIPQTTATLTVTEATHDNTLIVLDRAAGIAVTLPAASAGLVFNFYIKTTFTGASSIKSVSGADIMIGHASMGNNSDNTTVDWQALDTDTYDTIDLLGTLNSTGGIEGQRITIIGLAANLWFVEIRGDAAGTEATPFADTVA